MEVTKTLMSSGKGYILVSELLLHMAVLLLKTVFLDID